MASVVFFFSTVACEALEDLNGHWTYNVYMYCQDTLYACIVKTPCILVLSRKPDLHPCKGHVLFVAVCCSALHQVAVLCQFLDEVDYATAFNALQERNCNDAMDAFYHCIWDATLLEYIISILAAAGLVLLCSMSSLSKSEVDTIQLSLTLPKGHLFKAVTSLK